MDRETTTGSTASASTGSSCRLRLSGGEPLPGAAEDVGGAEVVGDSQGGVELPSMEARVARSAAMDGALQVYPAPDFPAEPEAARLVVIEESFSFRLESSSRLTFSA